MKIWTSGEVQDVIADSYRDVRKLVEKSFNEHFGTRDYGGGLNKITYIAIIRAVESSDYDEVAKYYRQQRTAEFRLKIAYVEAVRADRAMFVDLICDSLRRVVTMLSKMKIPEFDVNQFGADFEAFASSLRLVQKAGQDANQDLK